jgi:hypothetical protein
MSCAQNCRWDSPAVVNVPHWASRGDRGRNESARDPNLPLAGCVGTDVMTWEGDERGLAGASGDRSEAEVREWLRTLDLGSGVVRSMEEWLDRVPSGGAHVSDEVPVLTRQHVLTRLRQVVQSRGKCDVERGKP